jgi:hypothetical protein
MFPPILKIYARIGRSHSILATARSIDVIDEWIELGESQYVSQIFCDIFRGHVDVN